MKTIDFKTLKKYFFYIIPFVGLIVFIFYYLITVLGVRF